MPDRISIRQASSEDRDFVTGMVPSLLASTSPAWHNTELLAPEFREVLAHAINHQSRRSTVLIAEAADATPLGFISLKVHKDAAGVERAHVADLAVTDSARRTRVGTALMNAAESWARDLGMGLLSLDVWSTNENAFAFYRRLGYSAESVCLIKWLD
ncbi:MAG: GNAT family N-acetyltransferase [Solirubrobacteraceae bacterium]